MRFLAGMLLAVLACAAADTTVARALHAHRPHDLLLPAQALLLWGAFALLVALPARFAARQLRAGFAASLLALLAPVTLHHVLAARLRDGAGVAGWTTALLLLAVLGCVLVAALLLAALERRLARRRWPGLALALVSLAIMIPHGGGATRSGSAAPPASPRPNLMLLVWDTTRSDHLPPWGYDRPTTPHLADLAASSTLYENCWSASVFTLSSHVSMLTGLPPTRHGTSLRSQTVRARSVAQQLQAAGYRTGAFVGTSVLAAGNGIERGFEVYDDLVDPPVCDSQLWQVLHDAQAFVASRWPALGGDGRPHWFQDFERPADEVLAHTLDFVRADDGRPWFVMINLYDVHWPYLPDEMALSLFARPYAGPLDGYLFRADHYPHGHVPDAADKAHASDLYDGELWDLDRDVDAFLGQLDLTAGNLCILMTSDHGEGLGERDTWSHEDLYAPQTRVPLLLHAPGRAAAGRQGRTVSGIDVAPSLLDLAGLPPAALSTDPLAGLPLLRPAPADRIVFVQDHDSLNPAKIEDLATRDRLLLLRKHGTDTLHDPVSDPLSETDISAQHPAEKAALAAALDTLLQSAEEAPDDTLENRDALSGLGYVGK